VTIKTYVPEEIVKCSVILEDYDIKNVRARAKKVRAWE
jgi:hypothetical protein